MLQDRNVLEYWRKFTAYCLVILLFSILGGRYYWLMIASHQKYAEKATSNHIREVPIEAPRGVIFDRNGKILVDNKPSYSVSIVPLEIRRRPETLTLLAKILNTTVDELKKTIKRYQRGLFVPVKIRGKVPIDIISKLQEHNLELIGVTYTIEPTRFYPSPVQLTHVLGYVREIDTEDLERLDRETYQPGDLIGWKGVEKYYESYLRGTRGYRYEVVNAYGQEIGESDWRKPIRPVAGENLHLTIDENIQNIVETELGDSSGVVVILDHTNGEIVAMASVPGYSLEMMSSLLTPDEWRKLLMNPRKPLYDRALQGLYPPGSTFKLVAAAYALENKTIDPKKTVLCKGSYRLGTRSFGCWKEGGHGRVDLEMAIEQSCNVYFYHLIQDIGLNPWAEMAKKFGFGQLTGIDLPDEKIGSVPDSKLMDRKFGVGKWTLGNLLNFVVGQGEVLVTPLQLAQYAGLIAERGKSTEPHLLKYVTDAEGRVVFSYKNERHTDLVLSDTTWAQLQNGMYQVMQSAHGSGRAARQKNWPLYGKTGTAQNPHGENHAWFIGFSLDPDLPYAWAILLENGGTGGGKAAPLMGAMLRKISKLKAPQILKQSVVK
ncbi:MAG TPA: penicillin-binding protein 2 [Candidatus Marinimicrobia bacterium]|nr:MAG: penicillin-binding protein 2 [Candidatus Marinimicrobia bacterium CG1_02_48_14]PJA54753.1 MAG: penicillin-binding protein 2 [Candidatus Marinimicrobia bacterium CG_4_9_14_3_um_filter_48_9]HCW76837.1 penicillin-binding protein 2 [Candidatus Neomarinimicrobiota bacterium]